jgi:hypothetical protein
VVVHPSDGNDDPSTKGFTQGILLFLRKDIPHRDIRSDVVSFGAELTAFLVGPDLSIALGPAASYDGFGARSRVRHDAVGSPVRLPLVVSGSHVDRH